MNDGLAGSLKLANAGQDVSCKPAPDVLPMIALSLGVNASTPGAAASDQMATFLKRRVELLVVSQLRIDPGSLAKKRN